MCLVFTETKFIHFSGLFPKLGQRVNHPEFKNLTGLADSLVIRWPLGHVDIYVDVPVDHFYRVIEKTDLEVIN